MIAIYDPEGPTVTDALKQWRSREVLPTEMGSRELRNIAPQIRERYVFSAATPKAEYLEAVAKNIDDILSGKINMATGRWELMKKLKQLGYNPETGFPGEFTDIPPAKRGSLRDLSSEKRLNLVLETNVRMATNFGKALTGNTPGARYQFPAWELIRVYVREIERGTEESHSAGWRERWNEAGSSVEWRGASQIRLVALKDSPIWLALGMGAGDYEDTLQNPYPPFAFNSGMGWRAVDRAEVEALDLFKGRRETDPYTREMKATLAPSRNTVQQAFDKLSPDLQAALRKELGL